MMMHSNRQGLVDLGFRAASRMGGRAAGLAWSMWGLSLMLTALGLLLLAVNLSRPGVHLFDYWIENTVIAASFSTVGAVICARRPGNSIGWLFCAIGLIAALDHLGAEYAIFALQTRSQALPGGEALVWVRSWLWVLHLGLFLLLGLLFPNGRLPGGRWRWVVRAGALVVLAGAAWMGFLPGPVDGLGPIQNPLGVKALGFSDAESAADLVEAFMFAFLLVAAASLFVRLGRARGEERQQLKWFAYSGALTAGAGTVTYVVSGALPWWASWAGFLPLVAGLVGLPVAVGIAILKHHLYDIDFIINRTLVYGSLTACVVGMYVMVVGGLGTLLHAQGNLGISLLATGLVALLFQPLRNRLQGSVDRLIYGEREPYKVLSRLSRRLEATLAPEATLLTIVETVAQTLRLPYAAISLKQDGGFVTAAEYGTPVGDLVALPLAYQTEPVGQMLLAPRAPGEAFTPLDRRLLDDLARQAGVTVHAVRLTADLQRSRERLVAAREEERRRLRRDLHDGLGPTLAGLAFGLDAARSLLTREQRDADQLLAELKAQTQAGVSDIRRLVYDLRPPALDDLGLVSAIREQAANHGLVDDEASRENGCKNGLVFFVKAPEHLPPLPAAVEVACYRIAGEALTNVARHARARACHVRLSVNGSALELEISDDGVGISQDRRAGVGLSSMRERAAELGGTCTVSLASSGGTRVLARLPLIAREEQ